MLYDNNTRGLLYARNYPNCPNITYVTMASTSNLPSPDKKKKIMYTLLFTNKEFQQTFQQCLYFTDRRYFLKSIT